MKVNAAFIFIAPEADASKHNAFIETAIVDLKVVGVKDYADAEAVAKKLVADGVAAIELCGGFGNEGTARIAAAVGDKAKVGVVRFDCHPGLEFKSGDELF